MRHFLDAQRSVFRHSRALRWCFGHTLGETPYFGTFYNSVAPTLLTSCSYPESALLPFRGWQVLYENHRDVVEGARSELAGLQQSLLAENRDAVVRAREELAALRADQKVSY